MGSGSKAFSKSLAAYAFASEPLPANDNYLAVLSCGGEGDEPFQNLTHNRSMRRTF